MIYLGTSFIAPYYLSEATSTQVEAVLLAAPVGNFAISLWTQVEFASLVARKVRMNELSSVDAIAVTSAFAAGIVAYHVLEPSAADFQFATRLLQQSAQELGETCERLNLLFTRLRNC